MQGFDVLVLGGGVSGLRAAIAAKQAGAAVALITKVHPLRTNSGLAQGGLNAPIGPGDSEALFAEDTMRAGEGLCESDSVRILAQEASREVIWLERMGVPFNRDHEGRLDRRRFGSNSKDRTCYADDRTGHIVLQVLHEQFQREQIASFEEWFVTSLVVDEGGCRGALALDLRTGRLESFAGRAVLLATGGFTQLYRPSTASLGTTGDGQAMAYVSGARLMDLEMVQYHPTVFSGNRPLLITEAALAEGAQIVDQRGEPLQDFRGMPRAHICAFLDERMQDGSTVYLDLRPIGKEALNRRFPQAYELARAVAGLDIAKELVPIRPTAHRAIGGIEATSTGSTSIAGLFAAGECACNGVNGAGRLAGNTLTEAVVFGRRAGEAAARFSASTPKKSFPPGKLSQEEKRLAEITSGGASEDSSGRIQSELGQFMDEKVGLVRDRGGLQAAMDRIQALQRRHRKLGVKNPSRIYNYELTSYLELGSMLSLAEAVALAAQARQESRGAHRRADFGARDDEHWTSHTLVKLVGGLPQLDKKPVAGVELELGRSRDASHV